MELAGMVYFQHKCSKKNIMELEWRRNGNGVENFLTEIANAERNGNGMKTKMKNKMEFNFHGMEQKWKENGMKIKRSNHIVNRIWKCK